MIELHDFHGGIHRPGKKSLSNHTPIQQLACPKRLVVPLQMHIGEPARLEVAVGAHVGKGQRLARPNGFISAAIHAPTSGTVVAIESLPIPHPSGLSAPCIVIEADGEDHWEKPFEPWDNYQSHTPLAIRQRLRDAGVVGLGGAVFPTAAKLAVPPDRPIKTLILNGAECESYITCDDRVMRERADQIIEGGRILLHACGAERCLIGVEDNKPEAIASLQAAIEAAEDARFEVVAVPTRYPAGGEKQLILTLTGIEIPRKRHATDYGLLCQNVATAASVYRAVVLAEPVISRVVTVTGEGINHPGNFEVRIGTPMSDVIAAAGGYKPGVDRLLMGGPMMGLALAEDTVPVVKATNCLLALRPQDREPEQLPMPCIRCGQCAEACPADLLPQQLYWYSRAKDLDRTREYHIFDCIECGVCAAVCPAHIPLVQYFRFAKTEIWASERERLKADTARERHMFHQERIEREKAEREAVLAKKRAALAAKQMDQQQTGSNKPAVKDEIAAAMARAKARKAAAQTGKASEPAQVDSPTNTESEES